MSSKLDQGLDDIISSNRGSRGRGRARGGRRVASKAAPTAPVGGIKKNTRVAPKGNAKVVTPTGPANASGESKVIVSNLPSDVSEQQIKEYFGKSVGPVKRAHITYGPNGVSRGIATVVFVKPTSANDALTQLNGVLVDKRPMKIEVVLDATKAPPPPTVKGLSERIGQPNKATPKSAAPKPANKGVSTRGGRSRGRAGRRGRPARKTADELDAEMVDYFDATATTNGAANGVADGVAQPAVTEEVMDEIS